MEVAEDPEDEPALENASQGSREEEPNPFLCSMPGLTIDELCAVPAEKLREGIAMFAERYSGDEETLSELRTCLFGE